MNAADTRAARAQWVLVTPELADKMLSIESAVQRTTSPSVVARYATEMREGRWLRTAAPIQLDRAGAILDGMHRLRAVVESGTSSWMLVVYDAPPESFPVLDTGRRRHASQFVRKPDATRYTATAAVLAYPLSPAALPRTGTGGMRLDTETTLELCRVWETELDIAVPLARRVYKAAHIDAASHGALLAHVLRANDLVDRIGPWVDGLSTGAGLDACDPRLLLRNRWLDQHRYLRYVDRRAGLYSIVRCWNAFVTGEPMKKLQIGDDITPILSRH